MKKIILAGLPATTMGTSPVWTVNSMAAAPTAATMAQIQEEVADVLQVAMQGTNAVRDIWFAHLALFHGQPENAKKLTDDAAVLLAADDAGWAKFVRTDATTKMVVDRYVVVNTTVALSGDYVATPEEENAIKSANEKLAKGDQKRVIDALRLTGVGVIENQYLMSLNQTCKVVAWAQKLLKAGKYYEANLVLKDAEEGTVVDSETLAAGN